MLSDISSTTGGTNIRSLLSLTAIAVTFGTFQAIPTDPPRPAEFIVADTTWPARKDLAQVTTSPAFTLERVQRDPVVASGMPWIVAQNALRDWEAKLATMHAEESRPSRSIAFSEVFELPADRVSTNLIDIVDIALYADAPVPAIEALDDFVTVDFEVQGRLVSILIDDEAHHLSVIGSNKELRGSWISADNAALQDFHSHLWLELQGLRALTDAA